jgi:hypothetical protein
VAATAATTTRLLMMRNASLPDVDGPESRPLGCAGVTLTRAMSLIPIRLTGWTLPVRDKYSIKSVGKTGFSIGVPAGHAGARAVKLLRASLHAASWAAAKVLRPSLRGGSCAVAQGAAPFFARGFLRRWLKVLRPYSRAASCAAEGAASFCAGSCALVRGCCAACLCRPAVHLSSASYCPGTLAAVPTGTVSGSAAPGTTRPAVPRAVRRRSQTCSASRAACPRARSDPGSGSYDTAAPPPCG